MTKCYEATAAYAALRFAEDNPMNDQALRDAVLALAAFQEKYPEKEQAKMAATVANQLAEILLSVSFLHRWLVLRLVRARFFDEAPGIVNSQRAALDQP